ncbi:hypothetical protein QM012_000200 [Aureobasidium pullulans]|uniref:C2H2-type domain-containing protein n=1 Tax=Aureobasidium pullulans TaxID=5580 RepID=A0ABR0TV88_AURPU
MAPYNSHYGTRYDPVGSQYNQQHHQNYYTPNSQQPATPQQRQTTQTSQPQASVPPGYQQSYTAGYSNQPYYNYQSTESRAAETLSHLNAQEHTSTSTRQYDTNSRSDSSWNTSDRRTANPSPLYQQEQRAASNTANYSPVQSYSQPTTNTGTYSYPSYTQSEQPRAQTAKSNQPTTYDYSASDFRPASPYSARRRQQQTNGPRSSISSVASTNPRDHHLTVTTSHTSANVGQTRAPSVTPSSVHQRASSSFARQSNPPDQGYGPGPITVDPVAVYDPWPEQQRKLAEARKKAEAEEKRRAEEEAKIRAEEEAKRKAEEEVKRKAEEQARKRAEEEEARKKAEEEAKRIAEEQAKRKAEEEAKLKAEEEKKAEEKRKEEAKRRQHQQNLQTMLSQQRPVNGPRAVTRVQDTERMMAAVMADGKSGSNNGGDLETEMAAIFRKMRDLNQADPQMFARMWETERQAHLAKPQGNTPAPALAPAQTQRPQGPARPVFTPAQNQAPQAPMVPAPAAPSSIAVPQPSTDGHSDTQSNTRKQVSVPPPPGGPNATWPPGKKATLADTATRWLNARKENVSKLVSVETIHALLALNPSYMTLCESLERMGLYVDRAQFARALLSVVPDSAKANQAKPASPAPPPAQPPAPATTAPPPPTQSAQAAPRSVPAAKKWPNIGKFPGQRGRPSRAAVAALQERSNVVDLAGRNPVPPPVSAAPVSQPYFSGAHFVEAPTVNYQSQWAPADDAPVYPTSYTPPQPQHQPQRQQHQQQQQRAVIQNFQNQHSKYTSPYSQPHGQAPNASRPTSPAVPRPPPANKGEAARKRNFGELVDMSAISDSDEDMPPAKQANTGQYDMIMASEQANNAYSNGHFNPGAPNHVQQYYFNGQFWPASVASVPSNAATGARPVIVSKHQELKNQILVEPVRRAKVAHKSRYDPRTICRDVLLATGRHPDMRPLNQHLNVMHNFLKLHSKDVEQDKFDLDTIRWDLIDPGEPIDEPVESAEADRESTAEAETTGRNATDADDEGGSQDEGGAPLTSDIHPAVRNGASTTESTPACSTSGRHASASRLVAVEIETNKGKQGRAKKPFPKAKPGRPRKSLPVTASVSIGNGKSPAKPSTRRHTDIHQRAPSSIATDTSRKQQPPNMSAIQIPDKPVGYSAFRSQVTEYDENGNPIKRKGRPVGWRKSIHSKAALAAAAGETGDGADSKPSAAQRMSRGQAAPSYAPPKQRRSRQPKPVVEAKEPEVEFNVYKCEWEDCGAELHNIDTLRKHVLKLHGKKTAEGDYECAWFGCFQEDEVTAFDDMAQWMEHMESQHVKPISRTLGDGPRSGLSDRHSEQSDAYLSDSHGRLVTPIISLAPLKQGSREWEAQQEAEAAARRLTNLTGSRLNDEKLLQQMEEKKRIVGPALTKAGSVLFTEEFKRNFLDDEDFLEFVDPNEDGPAYPPDD